MNLANQTSHPFTADIISALQFLDTRARKPKQHLQVTLLQDDLGRAVLIHSNQSLINPKLLLANTGRAFKPASLQRWLDELKVDFAPVLASCHKFETFIDRTVLENDQPTWLQFAASGWGKVSDLRPLVEQPQVTVTQACEPAPQIEVRWDAPFESDELAVNEAVKQFTVRRIKQRLDETLEMPPLPQSASAIIELRNDPDADAEKLAKIIEADPSLAAQIVGWASNSYFSAPGQVRSVQDAIVRVLGYDLVMNLAMGLALGKLLESPEVQGGELPFWQQSLITAGLNASLCDLIPAAYRPTYGLTYLTGLLHGFGHLILHHSFKPQFDAIAKLVQFNRHLEPSQVELHVLGITREQVAVALLKVWRLPEEVIHGIKYLHQGDYAGAYADYAQINRIAVTLARQLGYSLGPISEVSDDQLSPLHINRDQLTKLIQGFGEHAENLQSMAAVLSQK
ncbi:HDOD domain-containing protein [Salinibius halmophilus]|uniref:HDOD domain-containing protein n=1 Tax=Salinibius halmophilus TaxID=1853216 RepID=UPI000E66CCDC|nr:HDOD domain-containing protein [Salinibius halmophilus]